MKRKTQEEIHKILRDAYNKINKLKKKGVSKKYLAKIGHMVFWLRLVPCNYKFLNNWKMPDIRTIIDIKNKQPLNICFCKESDQYLLFVKKATSKEKKKNEKTCN